MDNIHETLTNSEGEKKGVWEKFKVLYVCGCTRQTTPMKLVCSPSEKLILRSLSAFKDQFCDDAFH
jgi:hypothetical protein